MDIKEVKKILNKYAYQFSPDFDKEKGASWSKDDIAQQICQLFPEPKGDEGRLLTDKELVEECMPTLERFEAVEKEVFFPIPKPPEFSCTIRMYASTMSREAVRKTLAKTASIKDAECQARVERILNLFERSRALDGSMWWRVMPEEDWQALKEKELK